MLHIIQNDPEVPPGNIIGNLTVPYEIHHPYRGERLPDIDRISALIVLGGAMGANDDLRHPFLTELKSLIRLAVEAGVPYLGVCLGGQLLAAALGTTVVSNRWEELGNLKVSLTPEGMNDHLFWGISEEFATFQWHHDSFDIPSGGVLLASSPVCPHQAFRVGNNAWGVQFHPEVTEKIIRDWCAWDHETTSHVEGLVADFRQQEEFYLQNAQMLVRNFVCAAGLF